MAVFSGVYQETFIVDVSLPRAREHFSNLDNIGTHYDSIERYEKLNDHCLHICLTPRAAMGVTFKGEHICNYKVTDKEISWVSEPGTNMRSRGFVRLRAVGSNQTSVTYQDEIECEMRINRFISKALKPIVRAGIEKGVKAFLVRMRNAL